MEQTPGKIYSALAKFAKECKGIVKDSTNPHFKSAYASISAIQEGIKSPLASAGLVLVHAVQVDAVTTTVYAEDGSSVSSTFPFTVGKPQENGSAVTYAKRYNTAALLNLDTDADDDGNEAQKTEKVATAKPIAKPAPIAQNATELPWMDKVQLDAILRSIANGGYDGRNGQDVVRHIRTKFKVNREMATEIDEAVSSRVGNDIPKKDLAKEAGSIFKDPKGVPTKEDVDSLPF